METTLFTRATEMHRSVVIFQGTGPMGLVFTSDKDKRKFDISLMSRLMNVNGDKNSLERTQQK